MTSEDTRNAIIEAAFQVFSCKGYNAATTKEIAMEAGVAEVTLFRHFKTKQELLYEVARDRAVYNVEKLQRLVEENMDLPPAEALQIIIGDRIQVMRENQNLMRFGLVEAHHDQELLKMYETRVIKPVLESMEHYLRVQIARGHFRQVNVMAASRILMAMIVSQVFNFPILMEPPRDYQATAQELTDIYLRGLERKA